MMILTGIMVLLALLLKIIKKLKKLLAKSKMRDIEVMNAILDG